MWLVQIDANEVLTAKQVKKIAKTECTTKRGNTYILQCAYGIKISVGRVYRLMNLLH